MKIDVKIVPKDIPSLRKKYEDAIAKEVAEAKVMYEALLDDKPSYNIYGHLLRHTQIYRMSSELYETKEECENAIREHGESERFVPKDVLVDKDGKVVYTNLTVCTELKEVGSVAKFRERV